MRDEASADAHEFAIPGAGDDRLWVQFEMYPRKNATKSLEAGRDVYEDTPYVQIRTPGQKNQIVHRPARDRDKARFPRQWAAFQAGVKEPTVGTPLSVWPGCSRADVENLRVFGVSTVEQLAAIPDGNLSNFSNSPILAIREKAKLFLENAKGNAALEQLQHSLKTREAELAALKAQNEALSKRMDEFLAAAPPKPAVQPQASGKR